MYSSVSCVSIQESFAQRCFSLIDEYAPGFSSSVVGYEMLTPPDLEREFGLTGETLANWLGLSWLQTNILPADDFFFFHASMQLTHLKSSESLSNLSGGNIFHGAMHLDSIFLMRPVKGWYEIIYCLPLQIYRRIWAKSLLPTFPLSLMGLLLVLVVDHGRSAHRTPVKGLYLCGSGAHPGGGVMGAPGRNAAHVVLQDLKKSPAAWYELPPILRQARP